MKSITIVMDFLFVSPENAVTQRKRILIGIAGVMVVVAAGLALFLRYQLYKSHPDVAGRLLISGLIDPVRVVRDAYGVPRIEARNEHDLMVALGFVHAQDRLWQMDLQRRSAAGRLSEIFGSSTLAFDEMFRTVGLRRIAEAMDQALPARSRFRLQWYADGVNAFLASSRGKRPIEFDVLRYEPEPWVPLHSLLVSRLVAWELNLSWWTDATYGAIAERAGLQKTMEILPPYPANVAPQVPSAAWSQALAGGRGLATATRAYLRFLGKPFPATGSNAWAISPQRSTSGAALLANDTHLHLSLPGFWYEAQLSSPEYAVSGMTIPGVPGVVAGRNDSIAWGITNLMADQADFYVERLDTAGGGRYWSAGRWEPLAIVEEEIVVRDDSVRLLQVRVTRHGPIVSDVAMPIKKAHYPMTLSMRWVGAEIDDPIEAFNRINRAKGWKDFLGGVREFTVPGQNFVYADTRGNIGYVCGARIPVRGPLSSLFPMPGWEPAAAWRGFVPVERLPFLLNPPEGYIASANNKVTDDTYPYHVSDLWEPPARIQRLREVLGTPDVHFSPADCERLQTDTYSPLARQLLPFLLEAAGDSTLGGNTGPSVLQYFQNWNFTFGRQEIAATIYHYTLVRLIRNIFADELGEDLFHDFSFLMNVPVRVTTRLLQDGSSSWFDDIRTPQVESREDILRRSLVEALEEIRSTLGDDPRTWQWGAVHTVTLPHPFGLVQPLDRVFNLGPFPIDGGTTSLISGEYSLTEPFAVVIGPSFRQVFDLGNPRSYRSVIPAGQSGQVFHAHYDDQVMLWVHGSYRTVLRLEENPVQSVLTLEPRTR